MYGTSQAQALAAAVNVSGGNDENKRDLGARGGCELIVWAMQAFPSDKVVQLQGTWGNRRAIPCSI